MSALGLSIFAGVLVGVVTFGFITIVLLLWNRDGEGEEEGMAASLPAE
jgi:hypothetical protein